MYEMHVHAHPRECRDSKIYGDAFGVSSRRDTDKLINH